MGASASELLHREGDVPVGYRVLSVKPDSPAATVTVTHNGIRALGRDEYLPGTLVCFLDWIISINGHRLSEDTDVFMQVVKDHVGKPVTLEVFNAKSGRLRVVSLTPREWKGAGYLGLFVRFDTYTGTRDNVLHVLDVAPGSPCDLAGLAPDEDYILGADDAVFEDIDEFRDYISARLGDNIALHVYNAARDSVRELALLVTSSVWGSERRTGLGCVLARGQAHRLPNLDTDGANEYFHSPVPTAAAPTASNAAGPAKERKRKPPSPSPESGFTTVDLNSPQLRSPPSALSGKGEDGEEGSEYESWGTDETDEEDVYSDPEGDDGDGGDDGDDGDDAGTEEYRAVTPPPAVSRRSADVAGGHHGSVAGVAAMATPRGAPPGKGDAGGKGDVEGAGAEEDQL